MGPSGQELEAGGYKERDGLEVEEWEPPVRVWGWVTPCRKGL